MVRLLVVTAVVLVGFVVVNRLYRNPFSSEPRPEQISPEAAQQGIPQGAPMEIYQSREQLQQNLNQSVSGTQQQVEAIEQSLGNP
ncbi:hypothetical protein L1047_08115 [Synechococcus sp. Nb3U1]|uniref:hypothetical protein n=1 Tax=Synechococcus sp. Nb3U1 TaxID=1914529 RepID=UPI001F205EED|nr:hypothetical protein [Synechococcus sp. Nb3U1]MCF2971156.1 hypothetical protein [Synechococcus sp. Nb3U1]